MLDLPTSRADIFSQAQSASCRFFMFSEAKSERESGSSTANYRNRKWEAKDFNFRKSTYMLASGLWFKHREIGNACEQAFFALRN